MALKMYLHNKTSWRSGTRTAARAISGRLSYRLHGTEAPRRRHSGGRRRSCITEIQHVASEQVSDTLAGILSAESGNMTCAHSILSSRPWVKISLSLVNSSTKQKWFCLDHPTLQTAVRLPWALWPPTVTLERGTSV